MNTFIFLIFFLIILQILFLLVVIRELYWKEIPVSYAIVLEKLGHMWKNNLNEENSYRGKGLNLCQNNMNKEAASLIILAVQKCTCFLIENT